MATALEFTDDKAVELLKSITVLSKLISVRRCYEGGEHLVWIVNDKFALRIPVDQTNREPLQRERNILELISRTTPDMHYAPQCLELGIWGDGSIYYALYNKVDGVSVETAPQLVTAVTEGDLAHFLQLLKQVNVDTARSLGIRDAEIVRLANLKRQAQAAWARLQIKEQLDDQVLSEDIKHHLRVPDDDSHSALVLLHADLKGEHIFIDPHTGHLTGVLDWSDAEIGCPSTDIAGLAISVGADRASGVALQSGYGPAIVTKGVFMARCNAIVALDAALNEGDDSPEGLLRVQLRRAMQGTCS